LSKKYLPGMAVGFQHPKVKVHVGDGFKFLDDYKNEFDVIITDSSDPEGPAESLFQKPYFELLFGALKEGGVITTQGCTFSYISVDLVISLYIYFFFSFHISTQSFPHYIIQSWRCIAFGGSICD
jgi:spermidine synthase